MSSALIVHVRLHDNRYNGEGDWPPSPARLFQAFVAAVGVNRLLADVRDSLEWLQRQDPPIVGAPCAKRVPTTERVMLYLPNNDLDAVKGDLRRIAEIRSATKVYQPYLFDANVPFVYVWENMSDEDRRYADTICSLAELIYQFGRGVDMAWAWAEILDSSAVETLLAEYPGRLYWPNRGNGGTTLLCPHAGSLSSLDRRYDAFRKRFHIGNESITFKKAPPPSFNRVSYNSPAKYLLFELRKSSELEEFAAWPLNRISELATALRDGSVLRLNNALPNREEAISRVLIGRKPDGTNAGPISERVRIVPLPSIGHSYADFTIRRVLVEVPGGCPLRAEDVNWAFSGLEIVSPQGDEPADIILTPTSDDRMLRHYGVNSELGARTFRTITPAALPEMEARRRIDPTRKLSEAKDANERLKEIRCAAAAVVDALRHADIRTPVEEIRVQREPFDGRSERVEAFATWTRFSTHHLWHIEIRFRETITGPLIIGNGRFCGLGLMAPKASDV